MQQFTKNAELEKMSKFNCMIHPNENEFGKNKTLSFSRIRSVI